MATVAGDEEGQVGILLHSLHWNCCRGRQETNISGLVFHQTTIQHTKKCSKELTVGRGEDVIGSVQTQHRHLHRFELVDGTGIMVVMIVTGVTEHDGSEALVKFPNGPGLWWAQSTEQGAAL